MRRAPRECARFRFQRDLGWTILEKRVFQSRCRALSKILTKAEIAQNDITILVNLGDLPLQSSKMRLPVFGPASAPGFIDIAAPDFVFGGWPESGVDDFDAVAAKIAGAGRKPPQTHKLGWFGNENTHPSRKTLVRLGHEHHERMDIVDVGDWFARGDRITQQHLGTRSGPLMGMPDQVAMYRYLIDVQGRGYSARLKLLLHSGRPVLLQARPWRDFFFDDLKPWIHFVPVAHDFNDLLAALDRLDANPDLAKSIGENAASYARRHLTVESAIKRWTELLKGVTSRLR